MGYFSFLQKELQKTEKDFQIWETLYQICKIYIHFCKSCFLHNNCSGLCFGKYCKYAKFIFKNAKRFSNVRNFVSKTRNLYSFLLNLCKLRHTYFVCAFRHYGIFSNMQNFSSKTRKDFQIWDILFQKCNSFYVLYEKWNYIKQHDRWRIALCYSWINLDTLVIGTTLYGFRLILFHRGTLI